MVRGVVKRWQGSFGWIIPEDELGDDLASLLLEGQIYVNWRDVQLGLELAPGMKVEFLVSADGTGLVASDVRQQGARIAQSQNANRAEGRPWQKRRRGRDAVDPLEKLEKDWEKEDAELNLGWEMDGQEEEGEDEAVNAQEDEAFEESEELAPLLPGWDQHWCEDRQCHYYWHAGAKVSSWERPAVPIAPGEADLSVDTAEKVWEEALDHGASKKATPLTPLEAPSATKVQTITPVTPSAGFRLPTAPAPTTFRPVKPPLPRPAGNTVRRAPLPTPIKVVAALQPSRGDWALRQPLAKRPRF